MEKFSKIVLKQDKELLLSMIYFLILKQNKR